MERTVNPMPIKKTFTDYLRLCSSGFWIRSAVYSID